MQFIVPVLDVCMQSEENNTYPIVDKFPWYRVNAVLSLLSSGQTINIASVLGPYRIPLLGAVSTSEDVSKMYKII